VTKEGSEKRSGRVQRKEAREKQEGNKRLNPGQKSTNKKIRNSGGMVAGSC